MPKDDKTSVKKNWYVESWDIEANNNTFSSLVEGNAAAAQVAKTSSYISFYPHKDFRDLEVKGKNKRVRLLNENFPFFQKVSGDGLCGFHAAIVGTLAKCADNPENLKEFRKKLKQYPDEISGEKETLEAKKVVTEILRKIPRDNLTFDRFYELVSEEGKENISKKLANILFKNADFSPKAGENTAQKEARESDLESQKKFIKDPKKAEILVSDFAIADIMQSISPFKIETVTSENLEDFFGKTQKDAIYLVNGDGKHFDLLYSKSDKNMVQEAQKISLAEGLKTRRWTKEELSQMRREMDMFGDEPNMASQRQTQVIDRNKADNSNSEVGKKKKKVSFDEKEHVVEFDLDEPAQEVAKATKKLVERETLNARKWKQEDLNSIYRPTNQEKPKAVVTSEKEQTKKSETNNTVDRARIEVVKHKFHQHKKKQAAIEILIKPTAEQEDGYKIFDNKLVRALDKTHKEVSKLGKGKEKEVWQNLTTLDKRVLVESYNQSHQTAEIDFNSLFRVAKQGEKAELTVKSQNYVLDESKMSDLKKVIDYAVSVKSPSASMKKTSVSTLKAQTLGSILAQ